MNIFVTGGSGWVGSAVIPELLSAGHSITALARSAASERKLRGLGVEVVRGDIEDESTLASHARTSNGVIHVAFRHDLGNLAQAVEFDARAVRTLGEALMGTGKPFVVTGATPATPGRPATEDDRAAEGSPGFGRESVSDLALSLASAGVRPSVIRLPRSVHGQGDSHGFVASLAKTARDTGRSGYLGDGSARWPAVHVADAARLYRLALESAPAGTILHAVGEEGVRFRDIADAIARSNDVVSQQVEPDALGFLGAFAGVDQAASASATQKLLDWRPTHTGLIAAIDAGLYRA